MPSRRRDARGGKALELVGMKLQRLADEERGFGDGIGGAMRKREFGFVEAAHRIADEVEQCEQFAA